MKKELNKYVYWTPRILSIILIIFLTIFSFDVISPDLSPWQIALGMFMHNIPVFILIIILVIAWKKEIVGAVAFFIAGTAYVIFNLVGNADPWYIKIAVCLPIGVPAFLISSLFMVNWIHRKNNSKGEKI
jgi:hypothetical protein